VTVSQRAVREESGPFDDGPFSWIARIRLCRVIGATTWRRLALAVLVGWVPLALLAAWHGSTLASGPHAELLSDLPAISRYLVATPLFVLAQAVYLPQMIDAARALVDAGFITPADAPRYQALVVSTRRLLTSKVTLVIIIGLAFLVTFAVRESKSSGAGSWAAGSDGVLTPAGWWRVFVSHPFFLAVWCTWFWRVLLWTRFLGTLGRMDLRLIASHPDRLGGLHFVVVPLQGFAILALALGAIGAGTVAEALIADGHLTAFHWYFIGVHVLTVVAIFAGPLFFLSVPLLRLRNRGILEYGKLATNVARQFEARWIDANRRTVDADALSIQDFSATTDLYSVADRLREVNVFVVSLRHVAMLAGATLLPYAPVALAVVPLELILQLAIKAIS
jgi:hypothetical protein